MLKKISLAFVSVVVAFGATSSATAAAGFDNKFNMYANTQKACLGKDYKDAKISSLYAKLTGDTNTKVLRRGYETRMFSVTDRKCHQAIVHISS